MPLAKVDRDQTRRFTDGDAWLVLRTQLSAHESNAVEDLSSRVSIDARAAAGDGNVDPRVEFRGSVAEVRKALFGYLVHSWSLGDSPIVEDYADLDSASGAWVNDCMDKVLAERAKRAEGNGRSTRRRSSGAARGHRAATAA
ncbi:MAG TPA: hypothetical protein VFF79_12780 [Conexibacter sp.]|jgi:hypothetical protein|nr:hypothetical protein [Conexibacter sp.]